MRASDRGSASEALVPGGDGEKELTTGERTMLLLRHYMPILRWLPNYNASANLPKDIVAGLTVGFMAVPQALSYAAVAGLSAQYGLYNAFVGLVPYVFFGTSPHLISGPTAVMSLITRSAVPQTWNGDAVLPMTTDPSDMQYARLTFLLAFLAGLIQILLGTFKLGFVINLVSQPVIVGFTSAAAFLIVATQFSSLLGISKCHATAFGSVDVPSLVTMLHKAQADLNPSGTRPAAAQALINATIKALPDAKGKCEFYADVGHVLTHLDELKGYVILAGALCVGLLLAFKLVLKPALPGRLKVLANTAGLLLLLIMIPIGASIGPQLKAVGLDLVGHIDPGLPGFTNIFVNLSFGETIGLIPSAITVAAIGYMESMTIAKTVARKQGGYTIDPSQELTALGLCNVICSQFTGYPVTGSFSRTAVNADSGAASGLSALIAAAVVGIACATLTGVLASLPKVVLASIILVAAVNLIEVEQAVFFWRTSTRDFVVFAVVFVLVLVLGVEVALIAGIILHWLFVLTLTHGTKDPVAVFGYVATDGGAGHHTLDDAGAASSGDRGAPSLARAFSSSRHIGALPAAADAASIGASTASEPGAAALADTLHLPSPGGGLRLVDLAAPRYAGVLTPEAAAGQGRICLMPFNADITFNNNEKLRTVIDEALAVYRPRVVVIDCRGVNGVDVSGAAALRTAANDAVTRGASVLVAGLGAVEGRQMEAALRVHAEMHGPALTRFRCCGVDCPCCGPAARPGPALSFDEGGASAAPGIAMGSINPSGSPSAPSRSPKGVPEEHEAPVRQRLAVFVDGVMLFPSVGVALRHAAALAMAAAAPGAGVTVLGGEEAAEDRRNAALGLGKGGIGVPLSPMVIHLRQRAAARRRAQAETGEAGGMATRWQVGDGPSSPGLPEGGSPLLQLIRAWEALGGVDEPEREV